MSDAAVHTKKERRAGAEGAGGVVGVGVVGRETMLSGIILISQVCRRRE